MTETLLRTKLYIPPLRSNPVSRPHLNQRLDQGIRPGNKLVLVSAPAGFGKTTLIADWAASLLRFRSDDANPKLVLSKAEASQIRNPIPSWLSLDERDNDLTRFLTYLAAALQTVDREIGVSLSAVLQSPEAINVKIALTTLLNEIASFPGDIVLILDDYHVIESPAVDEAAAFLIEHLPPNMRLVIAYFGQVISTFWPETAVRLGLAEAEADVDPTFYADVCGEAIWDTAVLWTLPLAAVLLALGNPNWVYFGLVGGGVYLYFAGRGIIVRRVMQRRGIRIGSLQSLRTVYLFLFLWGVTAVITIIMAISAIRTI